MHKRAKIADPDQALSGPSLQCDGLSSIIPDLPVEEQGLTHHLMVTEAVWLAEAMWLQLLIACCAARYAGIPAVRRSQKYCIVSSGAVALRVSISLWWSIERVSRT